MNRGHPPVQIILYQKPIPCSTMQTSTVEKILLTNAATMRLPEDVVNIIKEFAFQDAVVGETKRHKKTVMYDIKNAHVVYSRGYERFMWERKIRDKKVYVFSETDIEIDEIYSMHFTSTICKHCGDFIAQSDELMRTNKSCFCPRDMNGLLWNDPDDEIEHSDDDDDDVYQDAFDDFVNELYDIGDEFF